MRSIPSSADALASSSADNVASANNVAASSLDLAASRIASAMSAAMTGSSTLKSGRGCVISFSSNSPSPSSSSSPSVTATSSSCAVPTLRTLLRTLWIDCCVLSIGATGAVESTTASGDRISRSCSSSSKVSSCTAISSSSSVSSSTAVSSCSAASSCSAISSSTVSVTARSRSSAIAAARRSAGFGTNPLVTTAGELFLCDDTDGDTASDLVNKAASHSSRCFLVKSSRENHAFVDSSILGGAKCGSLTYIPWSNGVSLVSEAGCAAAVRSWRVGEAGDGGGMPLEESSSPNSPAVWFASCRSS